MVGLDVFVLNEIVFGSQRHNENRNLSQFGILINKFLCKRHCEGDSPKQSLGLGLLRGVYTEGIECARNDNFLIAFIIY